MRKEIEKSLIDKAAGGDETAFGEIYYSLRDSIYGFAYRMLHESSAAEDITQEVFMFLLENPHKFVPERGSLFSFLCGVTRNKVMRLLQKRGTKMEFVQGETGELFELADNIAPNPLNLLLDEELFEKVEESLAKLPPLQREAIMLRELHELSCEEIARITDAEIGAIKVRLHRARKSLAREIAPYLSVKKKEMIYEMH